MMRDRCKSPHCRRQRMRGSDRCFYCARTAHRTPPEVAARNIAAQLGERDLDDIEGIRS